MSYDCIASRVRQAFGNVKIGQDRPSPHRVIRQGVIVHLIGVDLEALLATPAANPGLGPPPEHPIRRALGGG